MARYCDALFLLAEADVATTIAISAQVKDKNCIFTGYQIFVTGKILAFHQGLYNKMSFIFFGGGGWGVFLGSRSGGAPSASSYLYTVRLM